MPAEYLAQLARQTQVWQDEAMALALAAVMPQAAPSEAGGSGGSAQVAQPSAEVKEQRRLVTALVDRSRRVFGVIWAALPDELRAQAVHVPQGCAAALWRWLEQKFQNTEEDNVFELLQQWSSLRQDEDESFDAYRARVCSVKALLEHAKEPQSARMVAFVLLDKLQPRYKQAVLALKASGQLKDAGKIAWDSVAAFINQHERSEMRMGAEGAAASVAMAAGARGYGGDDAAVAAKKGGAGWSEVRKQRSDRDPRRCYRCNKRGHLIANCPAQARGRARRAEGGAASPRGGVGGDVVGQAAGGEPLRLAEQRLGARERR
jgi:hypothetical protein